MSRTILVCDPDAGSQALLFRVLAEAGYAVASAADGAEAAARIESDPPDLVLVRADLPGRGGSELCSYAKERPEPLPVVVMTREAEPLAEADATLRMPIEPSRVLETVGPLVEEEGGAAHRGARVLVVDDDQGILELLTSLLGGEGYRVSTAACGREALEALGAERPDVMLLDVQLPGMSGFEVLAAIRERHGDLPVIMMTGHGSEEVATDSLRLGADDYVAKPLRIRSLCFRVERTLEKARLRDEQERLNDRLRQTTLALTDRLAGLAEANQALRDILGRVVAEVGRRLKGEGAAAEAGHLLARLSAVAEADDPVAACAALERELGERVKGGPQTDSPRASGPAGLEP
ncbi:MAG: response regulator [Planctomycetota bacterium]